MKQPSGRRYRKLALSALLAVSSATLSSSHAALTDLTTVPLGASKLVPPNLLFILDGSGSMNAKFVPDFVDPPNQMGLPDDRSYNCRPIASGTNWCQVGDPPYQADRFNGLAYNPQSYYKPGVNGDGTSRPTQDSAATAGYTKVISDSYLPDGTVDLTKWSEYSYCNNSSGSVCKRNGIDNGATFAYATPPKPSVAAVSFTRAGSTVTGTKTSHGFLVGDVIDVVGAGSCSVFAATVASATASTFTYTWGNASTTPTCSAVSGTAVYSARGYPEFNLGGQVASPANATKPTGTTVTFTWPNSNLAVGDIIDVAGPAANCKTSANGGAVTAVTATNFTFSGVTSGGACGGSATSPSMYSFSKRQQFRTANTGANTGGMSKSSSTVTVTYPGHGLVAGDLVDITGPAGVCITTSSGGTVAAPTATSFTVSISGSGTCGAGTYTIARRPYNVAKNVSGPPTYYTLSPTEYCSDSYLTTCTASTVPTGAFVYPAYLRFCSSLALAQAAPPVTGGAPASCNSKYYGTYTYPRYGLFTRGDIKASITSYPNRPNRADCKTGTPGTCTYAEEMTNFANWHTYYRRRMQAMKTSAGLAFKDVDASYRVGFIVISPSTPVNSTEFLPIKAFDSAQKNAFYNIFYAQEPSGGTPLRSALARAGRYFAHKTDGINAGMTDDPVQYSCQQNFTLLTTDGYWKGSGDAPAINGSTQVGNQDGLNAGLSTRAWGSYDGGCADGNPETTGGCANTLADVAMYYYKTDLRDASLGNGIGALGDDVTTNDVPTIEDKDEADWQHMVTYSLGLADGLMTWQKDYETAGDFYKIKTSTPNCFWSGAGTCNWPTPVAAGPSALDDLWHAAVNGRGVYYQAADADTLTSGLANALASVKIQVAAAAAGATSTANVTPSDNLYYTTLFESVDWSGDMTAKEINPTTGNVIDTELWSAQQKLDPTVGHLTDSRTIYTFDKDAGGKLKPFTWATMTATEQGWLNGACTSPNVLSQCASLPPLDLPQINDGANVVSFIRGQKATETEKLFRSRKHVLGDSVNAAPVYVRAPLYNFGDASTPSYAAFKAANATRSATVYLGANDGMLHAFNGEKAGGGVERWAYVPRMLMKKLYKLGDFNYANNHTFYVDGTPTVVDALIGGTWRSVLVGGLNHGGRGYYALDVTDPNSPKALWEFCNDSTVCDKSDPELGFTYGNPIITKRAGDPSGKYVVLVTSGYNNTSPNATLSGKGFLYVLDLETGTQLEKISTGVGSDASPSGLAKINAAFQQFDVNNAAQQVYGGDLFGNIWRFDLTTTPTSVIRLGFVKDAAAKPQPITTKPEIASVKGKRAVFFGTGRYLGKTDLVDPALLTPASGDAYNQSFYAIKDTGVPLGDIRNAGNLQQQTLIALDASHRTTSKLPVDWASQNGWFIDFNPGASSPGERVNVDFQLHLGTIILVTNVPVPKGCKAEGDTWDYALRYDSGSYVSTAPGNIAGSKTTGTMTAGIVVFCVNCNGGIIGGNGSTGDPGGGGQIKKCDRRTTGRDDCGNVPVEGVSGSGKRMGWRELTR